MNAYNGRMMMKPEDVRSLISEFVPEKVSADKWIRRIESLRTTFDWDERTILHYAVMRLGEVSQLWYEGVEDTIEGWADFKQRMVRAFPVRKDEVDVHNALSVRMKRSNESYENFVYDVVFQARAVNLSEAAIIKYVINGIPDCNLRLDWPYVLQITLRWRNYWTLSIGMKVKRKCGWLTKNSVQVFIKSECVKKTIPDAVSIVVNEVISPEIVIKTQFKIKYNTLPREIKTTIVLKDNSTMCWRQTEKLKMDQTRAICLDKV